MGPVDPWEPCRPLPRGSPTPRRIGVSICSRAPPSRSSATSDRRNVTPPNLRLHCLRLPIVAEAWRAGAGGRGLGQGLLASVACMPPTAGARPASQSGSATEARRPAAEFRPHKPTGGLLRCRRPAPATGSAARLASVPIGREVRLVSAHDASCVRFRERPRFRMAPVVSLDQLYAELDHGSSVAPSCDLHLTIWVTGVSLSHRSST